MAALRLRRELREMINDPPEGCYAGLDNGDDIFKWICTILGPSGTVYENGIFTLNIKFARNHPLSPPKIRFRTPIYHCNISKSSGVVCLDFLNSKWSPCWTVSKILLGIRLLLIECNPDDPLESSISRLYKHDREDHDYKAREYTRRHARK